MKVHYGLDNLFIHNPVVTLGSFDGVHKGHAKVLRTLREQAQRLGGETLIVSFEPHPRSVLYPQEKAPGILTTLDEKIAILDKYGVDHLLLLPFTPELAKLDYEEFVKRILVEGIHLKELVVGYDHRFGRNREGCFESLKQLAHQYSFNLMQEQVYEERHINISSTKIRNALAIGDINTVNNFLGYAYSFVGEVVIGNRIGRTIGFPTANLRPLSQQKLLPAFGVYGVEVVVDGLEYYGMLNIGTRPTVSRTGEIAIEANIFNFHEAIYGKYVTIRFLFRIRGERRFDTLEELRLQLTDDRDEIYRELQRRRICF